MYVVFDVVNIILCSEIKDYRVSRSNGSACELSASRRCDQIIGRSRAVIAEHIHLSSVFDSETELDVAAPTDVRERHSGHDNQFFLTKIFMTKITTESTEINFTKIILTDFNNLLCGPVTVLSLLCRCGTVYVLRELQFVKFEHFPV